MIGSTVADKDKKKDMKESKNPKISMKWLVIVSKNPEISMKLLVVVSTYFDIKLLSLFINKQSCFD